MSNSFEINTDARNAQDITQSMIEIKNPLSKKWKPIEAPATHRNDQSAEYQFEILMRTIKEFEEELDDNYEVAAQLAAFGQSIVMQVASIGYINPAVIRFHGYVNGQKSQLIQHINQLNFLLIAVPKSDPERPAHRIGFLQYPEEDAGQE